MPYPVWTGLAAIESNGDLLVLQSPTVTVRNSSGDVVAAVYGDRDGNNSLGNPFTAGTNGEIVFYVESGRYQITATDGENTAKWNDVLIGTAQGYSVEQLQAIANSGVYGSTSSGISATSDGDYFWVPESGALVLYQNNSGSATEVDSFPGLQVVADHVATAKRWATKTGGTVADAEGNDTGEYGAKEYAQGDMTEHGGSAKAWASADESPDGSGAQSAKAITHKVRAMIAIRDIESTLIETAGA